MRFSRDRRGYENTFVLHGERRRGKGRPRLLYWFRTPPEVKVGRAALDEEAIRLIEELNPDIEFDWTRILKGEGQDSRRPDEDRKQERSRTQAPQKARRRPDVAARDRTQTAPAPEVPLPPAPGSELPESTTETAALADPASEPEAQEISAPPHTPAHARLGGEGVARLRGRYAEVMARISERIADEARREELKSLAERLNPDNWVTDDEVKAGLEEYEGVFASLRLAVGARRRRRKRRGRPGGAERPGEAPHGAPQDAAGAEPEVELPEKDVDAEDL